MDAPRIILSNELQKLGVSEDYASTIALDAGSSQAVVNREYFLDYNILATSVDLEKVLELVNKFYSGELFEKYLEED